MIEIFPSSPQTDNKFGYLFEYVILKIMQTLFKPHILNAFDKLKNYNIYVNIYSKNFNNF